jgi:hypothetical protein
MMPAAEKYRARASAVFTELDDGTAVVLDLDTKLYYTLNSTGAHVWKQLALEPMHADTLADALCSEFQVEPQQARVDVETLLGELAAHRLVDRLEP